VSPRINSGSPFWAQEDAFNGVQPADAAIRMHDVVIGGVRLTAREAAPDGSLHGRLIVDVERCRAVSRLHTEPGASP
jgi:hypothetical protein